MIPTAAGPLDESRTQALSTGTESKAETSQPHRDQTTAATAPISGQPLQEGSNSPSSSQLQQLNAEGSPKQSVPVEQTTGPINPLAQGSPKQSVPVEQTTGPINPVQESKPSSIPLHGQSTIPAGDESPDELAKQSESPAYKSGPVASTQAVNSLPSNPGLNHNTQPPVDENTKTFSGSGRNVNGDTFTFSGLGNCKVGHACILHWVDPDNVQGLMTCDGSTCNNYVQYHPDDNPNAYRYATLPPLSQADDITCNSYPGSCTSDTATGNHPTSNPRDNGQHICVTAINPACQSGANPSESIPTISAHQTPESIPTISAHQTPPETSPIKIEPIEPSTFQAVKDSIRENWPEISDVLVHIYEISHIAGEVFIHHTLNYAFPIMIPKQMIENLIHMHETCPTGECQQIPPT